MPGPGVRPATTADLPELARMRRALQDLLLEYDPRVWRLSDELVAKLEEFYQGVMEKDTNRIFVACDAGRPVGMLMVRILDNPNMDPRPIGRIDDAWVDPAHRRRGLMRELTGACCRFLEERNVPTVMLDWAIRNVPSVHCWQNLGFEPLITMGFTSPAKVLGRGRATD